MKKIILSLTIISIVAAIAIGGTIAYFNDTETSTGNIFTAGSIDLKVDHVKQTYNGVDCKTCSVTLISDPTNMVVSNNGNPVTPYPAVYAWVHPNWTSQDDPTLDAANAEWIWESNPTKQVDTTQDVTYTFKKTFDWWGPITGSDLWFAVGSDNSVEVWLNGVMIGENTGEYGYKKESMLHIPGVDITNNVEQGNNVLEFIVKNWGLPNGTPYNNPAGLIYKFEIDGLCEDDYFKTHCNLWGEKDLEDERFFVLDDVKPGDHGVNVISLHVYDNDAWACLIANNFGDDENGLYDPEVKYGDNTVGTSGGELSDYLNVYIWHDDNGNGIPESGETKVGESLIRDLGNLGVFDSSNQEYITSTTTKFIGLAWCAGDIEYDEMSETFTCDGSTMKDDAQSDSFTADLTAYAEQVRNNPNFICSPRLLDECQTDDDCDQGYVCEEGECIIED